MRLTIIIIAFIALSISKIGFTQTYWEPIVFPDTLVISSINAEKEGVLFVSTGDQQGEYKGVFRTFDNGASWEEIIVDTTVPYLNYYTINRDKDQTLYLGTNERIYRSFDDGNTFEKIFDVGMFNIFTINFSEDNDIYAGGWRDIVRSTDNGTSWDTIYLGYLTFFYDIDFGLNGEIYAVGRNFTVGSGGGGFYRSLDSGLTWENTLVRADGAYSIAVNDSGAINVDGNLISYDLGETWFNNSEFYASDIEKNQYEELIASYGSGVRMSQDWGETWTDISGNLISSYVNQVSITPNGHTYILKSNNYYQLYHSTVPVNLTSPTTNDLTISIFPNPTKGYFTVKHENNNSPKLIGVYNYFGYKITGVDLLHGIIDLKNKKNGLYTIVLELNDQILIKKIIKN